MKTAVVVIPTFNEVQTIGKMMDHLFVKIFPQIKGWACKILIVDANSPDGTADLIRKKQKEYPNLDLLVEVKKEGIGAAYVKGFKVAIAKHKADVVIEFDGDFQHPPETIPVLLREIDQGYDYVIGSRKIKGGAYPRGWGLKRVFFTEFGGLVARFILFFPFKNFFKVTDPTTGLKASRVKGFVDEMDMDHLYSRQFGYKLEFLYKMTNLGAKIKEIPLQFGLRTAGESKITSNTAKDILRTVILCRWFDKTTQKFLKFGIVGFIGYLVNASTLWYFAKSGLREWLAWLLSTELAIISNFTWNNLWTFKEEQFKSPLKVIQKFLQFNFTSAGALGIQTVTGSILTLLLGGQYRQLVLPGVIVFLVLPYNWLMYNRVIWKKK